VAPAHVTEEESHVIKDILLVQLDGNSLIEIVDGWLVPLSRRCGCGYRQQTLQSRHRAEIRNVEKAAAGIKGQVLREDRDGFGIEGAASSTGLMFSTTVWDSFFVELGKGVLWHDRSPATLYSEPHCREAEIVNRFAGLLVDSRIDRGKNGFIIPTALWKSGVGGCWKNKGDFYSSSGEGYSGRYESVQKLRARCLVTGTETGKAFATLASRAVRGCE